jgi:tRNA(Ile)-lysidine synthase
MALAALYATARRSNRFLPRPHGFIVDHKVRPESTEEAEWVAEQLREKCTLHEHNPIPW